MFGKTEVERNIDENGHLTFYRKTNKKSTRIFSHPHNPVIVRTKTKRFQNKKLVEKSFTKRKVTMANWEGKTLKYRRTYLNENGNKVKEKSN